MIGSGPHLPMRVRWDEAVDWEPRLGPGVSDTAEDVPTALRALRLRRSRKRRAAREPASTWIVLGAVLLSALAFAWATFAG